MNFIIRNILRIGIGSVFIIAAILKLLTIDEFEIYIYSFNIFSFFITTIISRLIIAGELVLGLFFIFKICYRFTWKSLLTIQILFSLFLIYVILFRDDSNCHCFGELVKLSPTQSHIKNFLIIIGLAFIGSKEVGASTSSATEKLSNSKFPNFQNSKILKIFIPIIAIVGVMIICPPDSIYKMIYSSEKEISTIDMEASFKEIVRIDFVEEDVVFDSTSFFNLKEENQIIVIVSSGCKYCRLGVKKLSMIMEREGVDSDNVDIFIWGSREGIADFRKETMTEDFNYWHILPNRAIKVTLGRFPIFIWFDKKEIVKIGDFRDLDDDILWSI